MPLTWFLPKDLDLRSKSRQSLTPFRRVQPQLRPWALTIAKMLESSSEESAWPCRSGSIMESIRKVAISRFVCSQTMSAADRLRSWRSAGEKTCRDNSGGGWTRECSDRNSPSVAQAQERPADAVQHAGPSWSAQEQGWFRHGHCTSGYQTYSQASSEPWIAGWQGGWAAPAAPTGPAVAADGEASNWESHVFTQPDALATMHDGTFGFGSAKEGQIMRIAL